MRVDAAVIRAVIVRDFGGGGGGDGGVASDSFAHLLVAQFCSCGPQYPPPKEKSADVAAGRDA